MRAEARSSGGAGQEEGSGTEGPNPKEAEATGVAEAAGTVEEKGGRGSDGQGALPRGLIGGMTHFGDRRLCFGFNLGQCKDVKPGEPCSRGWHLCCALGLRMPSG